VQGACDATNYSSFFPPHKTFPVTSPGMIPADNSTATAPGQAATMPGSPVPPLPESTLQSPAPQPGTSVVVLSPTINSQPPSPSGMNVSLPQPTPHNGSSFPLSMTPPSAPSHAEATCYLGCFSDNPLDRALPRKMRASLNQTIEACHATAQQKNVSLFALQYGKEWVRILPCVVTACWRTCTIHQQSSSLNWNELF
jgi:hypothetical protein